MWRDLGGLSGHLLRTMHWLEAQKLGQLGLLLRFFLVAGRYSCCDVWGRWLLFQPCCQRDGLMCTFSRVTCPHSCFFYSFFSFSSSEDLVFNAQKWKCREVIRGTETYSFYCIQQCSWQNFWRSFNSILAMAGEPLYTLMLILKIMEIQCIRWRRSASGDDPSLKHDWRRKGTWFHSSLGSEAQPIT